MYASRPILARPTLVQKDATVNHMQSNQTSQQRQHVQTNQCKTRTKKERKEENLRLETAWKSNLLKQGWSEGSINRLLYKWAPSQSAT